MDETIFWPSFIDLSTELRITKTHFPKNRRVDTKKILGIELILSS